MRTFGRVYALNKDGSRQKPQPPGYPYWQQVSTDANGYNDAVQLTTLCQVLQLNLGESPFYANFGIPAVPTIVQQVQPDNDDLGIVMRGWWDYGVAKQVPQAGIKAAGV